MKTIRHTIKVAVLTWTLSVAMNGQNGRVPVEALALSGQPAPNSSGASFVGFNRPSVNSRGSIVFRAELTAENVSYGAIPGKLIPVGIFSSGASENVTRI